MFRKSIWSIPVPDVEVVATVVVPKVVVEYPVVVVVSANKVAKTVPIFIIKRLVKRSLRFF